MSKGEKPRLKTLKWYKKLATEKGRLEAGAFMIEGDRAVKQIIDSQPESVIEVVTCGEPLPAYQDYPFRYVSDSQFRSICHTKTPQGLLAIVKIPSEAYSDRLPDSAGGRILLLEDIQDPGNVGTIIRTAAAFDFAGVILTPKCADPFSPKCVQATAGALLATWLRRTAHYLELAEALKARGYPLIATELNGSSDTSIFFERATVLLALGNEASGLSRQLLNISDYRFRIPVVKEKAESLNVAVSAAICMYLCSLR